MVLFHRMAAIGRNSELLTTPMWSPSQGRIHVETVSRTAPFMLNKREVFVSASWSTSVLALLTWSSYRRAKTCKAVGEAHEMLEQKPEALRKERRLEGGSSERQTATLGPEEALDRLLGTGAYQLNAFFVLMLGMYGSGFVFDVLPVLTHVKMQQDPSLQGFTKDTLSFAASMLAGGFLVGSAFVGYLMDSFGRKPVVLCGCAGLLVTSVAMVLLPSVIQGEEAFYAYVFIRFLQGLCSPARVGASVYALEIIPGRFRGYAMIVANLYYSLGAAVMVEMSGTIFTDLGWGSEVLFWCLPFFVALVVGLQSVEESVHFSYEKKRTVEACNSLKEVAAANGTVAKLEAVVSSIRSELNCSSLTGCVNTGASGAVKQGATPLAFLGDPALLFRVVAISAAWTSCSASYFGLTFGAGQLSSDLYANLILLLLADIPGVIITLLADKLGRRSVMGTSLLLAGAGLLLCSTLQNGTTNLVVCALVGRMFVNVAFTTIYVYAPELFPTGCRSSAIGIGTFVSRLGMVVAPFTVVFPISVTCTVFGSMCLLSAGMTFFLPETLGKKMDQAD